MLLAHVPATVGAVSSLLAPGAGQDAVASVILLSASHLFFLLEIAFAPSLQLLTDRRAAIALLLVVALLHTGVLDHGLPDLTTATDSHVWLVLCAAGAVIWRDRMRVLPRAIRAAPYDGFDVKHRRSRRAYALACVSDQIPPNPRHCWRRSPLRAPPPIH